MTTQLDVSVRRRLYTAVWWAARLVSLYSFAAFITIYAVNVMPTDYEVQTGLWLLVQPIVLVGMVLGARAVGHPVRATSVAVILLLVVFALAFAEIMTNLVLNSAAIVEWSERFPDRRFHQATLQIGGPMVFFLGWIAPAAILLAAGALLAIVLRFWRIRLAGASVTAIETRTRAAVAKSGDAPGLITLLDTSRRAGWAYGMAAVVLLMLPLLLPGREWQIPMASGLINVLPDILARLLTYVNDRLITVAFAVVVSLVLWRMARKRFYPEARFVLARDKRPPVLLLRSFEDDHAVVRPTAVWRRLLHVVATPARRLLAAIAGRDHHRANWPMRAARVAHLALLAITRRRIEEIAARCLAGAGPFIAVGDPRVDQPELGAFRAVLGDDEWRGTVSDWMRDARIIVLIAGETAGLRWELRTAAETGALQRMIVLLPPGTSKVRTARWTCLVETLAAVPTARSWHDALRATSPDRVLAIRFADDGSVVRVVGSADVEADYDLAIRIGQGLVVT